VSRPANENSDAVNNNVMSHSVTNPQTLTSQNVQRSASTTNPQKTGLLTLSDFKSRLNPDAETSFSFKLSLKLA